MHHNEFTTVLWLVLCCMCHWTPVAPQQTVNLNVVQGAIVWSNNAKPACYASTFQCRYFFVHSWDNVSPVLARTYLLFNISEIPSTATILSAKLNLAAFPKTNDPTVYKNTSAALLGWGPPYGGHETDVLNNMEAVVSAVSDAWAESTLTWANQPTSTGTSSSVLSTPIINQDAFYTNVTAGRISSYRNYSVDVTNLLPTNATNAFGVQLKMSIEAPNRRMEFCSHVSWSSEMGCAPFLEVTYQLTALPTTPSAASSSSSNTNYIMWGGVLAAVIVVCVAIIIVVVCLCVRARKRAGAIQKFQHSNTSLTTHTSINETKLTTISSSSNVSLHNSTATTNNQRVFTNSQHNSQTQDDGSFPRSLPTQFPPDKLVNYSELIFDKELGKGSFGVVKKATWHGKEVAVKQLLEQSDPNELNTFLKELENFRKEGMLMLQVTPHPNVVRLFGVCERPLCLITEYLTGGVLHDLLNDHSISLSKTQILRFMRDITSGLSHLHKSGIIHRDMAARNVLLDDKRVCKVSDFGMSRLGGEDDAHTQSDVGPLKWMAPEAIQELKYSVKTDTYSLAVVFCEILNRQPPYPDIGVMQVAIAVIQQGLRPDIPEWAPEPLHAVIAAMFSSSPEERPPLSTVLQTLEQLLRTWY